METIKKTRTNMTEFWESHSAHASLEEMMLDSNARTLHKQELPEVLSLLPDLKGKRVLELGAGIGRFTGILGEVCKHVTAVDFMASFVEKNKAINGHLDNINFMQADVTVLDVPLNSYDVIFSNWLFMYLCDEELVKLAGKMLGWLKDGGFLFFRESCFHQSGDKKRGFNPTKYRHPREYNSVFQGTSAVENGSSKASGLDMIMCRSIQSYIKLKNNPNQYCWLWQKVKQDNVANHGFTSFQQFLDSKQYTLNGILRYEKVFGDGYVSTGGSETTEEFVELLKLQPGQMVLDVGCGIGGGDFYMAEKFGVTVDGIDLSSNMIEIAIDRAHEKTHLQVSFEIGDITKREYAAGSFDVVYSRDTLLHIADKPALFSKFLTWLKPGGKLLISDYCCGEPPHSQEFQAYVAQRGYTLFTPKQYGKLIEEAGFVNVKAEDRMWQFKAMLEKELERMTDSSLDVLKDFSDKDIEALRDGWEAKIKRTDSGHQVWGLFYAEKKK